MLKRGLIGAGGTLGGDSYWLSLLGGTGFEGFLGVTVDSANNIVAVGFTNSNATRSNNCLVAKYDNSGTLLWDRTLGGTGTDISNDVMVDSANNIVAVSYTSSDGAGANDCLVAKLSSDGSGVGTYGSLIYQDATLVDAEAVLTSRNIALNDAAAVLTDAAAVLTDAPAILTEEFFEIPT